MKKKQWILGALACVLCLSLGFGAGLLLANDKPVPAQDAAPLLGAAVPQASAEETQPALLGASGIGGFGGTVGDAGVIPMQITSLMDKLANLDADFSSLTAQAQAEAAKYDDWLSLMQSMNTWRPDGKSKNKPVPSSLYDTCAALGVTLACKPGGSLDMKGWANAMAAIRTGSEDLNLELQQLASQMKSKSEQYKQVIYELNLKLQQMPNQPIRFTDNTLLMQTVIAWLDEECERKE
jgi:hypothetical protein